jgi:hypothetical protein
MHVAPPSHRGRPLASRAVSSSLFIALAFGAGSASAQSAKPTMPDPKACVVVVENIGDVGLRIADAQGVIETVVLGLRKRVGNDSVVYLGTKESAAQMKRLLGKNTETTIQDTQIAYFEAAEKAAPWRVKAKMAMKKGKHVLTVSCRKHVLMASSRKRSEDDVVEEKQFSGKTFLAARDALIEAMPTFCKDIAPPVVLPIEGTTTSPATPGVTPGLKPKEPLKPWSPPPRRD